MYKNQNVTKPKCHRSTVHTECIVYFQYSSQYGYKYENIAVHMAKDNANM